MRGQIICESGDGRGVAAFGCEQDAGLVDIDAQRDMVVAALCRGLSLPWGLTRGIARRVTWEASRRSRAAST